MAKGKRPTPRQTLKQKKASPIAGRTSRAVAPPQRRGAGAARAKVTRTAVPAARKRARGVAVADPAPEPAKRSTYADALTLYEEGVKALQGRQFGAAARFFSQVVERFPEERELLERAHLYLKVCERELEAPPKPPRTAEERLYAATLAINSGSFDQAIALLQSVGAEAPENDFAQYMLGLAHAKAGQLESALTHLRRAIQMNPSNRSLARTEADLDVLRASPDFRSLTAQPGPRSTGEPRRRRTSTASR